MEPALRFDPAAMLFDVAVENGDLAAGSELFNAVALSLFCDRRAANDDRLPDGTKDRRGWTFDAYPGVGGDLWGSRLWLLAREKDLPAVLVRAREYAEESLEWLLEEEVATAITVLAYRVRRGVLGLAVRITLAAGDQWDHDFVYQLETA